MTPTPMILSPSLRARWNMRTDPIEVYLVTGCAGFIGFHLSRRLLKEGKQVYGLDNINCYYDVSLKQARLNELQTHENFSFTLGDIADLDIVQKLFKIARPQIVLHMAAQAGVRHSIEQPQDYIVSNLNGFLSILEACRHHPVRHLLYASSSSVYGGNARLPFSVSDGADHPISLYAASKRSNELMAHSYSHLFNIPTTGLRYFTVYGPWGRPDMALFKFTRAILENAPIDIFNHGNMQRDFTYIDDAVEATLRLVSHIPERHEKMPDDPSRSSAPFQLFNIGSKNPVALDNVIAILEKHLGREAKRHYLPQQPGDVVATSANLDSLEQAIGAMPRTSLDTGIRAFVDWYKDFYKAAL